MLVHEFLGPQAAEAMGLDLDWMDQFLYGNESVTEEVAQKLAAYTGVSAEFWTNLQTAYDESVANQERRRREEGEGMGS
jgi:plasmid maintenance system antidote protein VapI